MHIKYKVKFWPTEVHGSFVTDLTGAIVLPWSFISSVDNIVNSLTKL